MIYTVTGLDRVEPFTVNISTDVTNSSTVNRAIKSRLTRNKINWINISLTMTVDRHCGFCDDKIFGDKFIYTINEDVIRVTDCVITHDLNYCKQRGCPGKRYNGNSTQFIMKSRNMTESEAIEFLHSRNSTPFYRVNHKSDEDYKNYQNTFFNMSNEDRHSLISKQNYARSLDGFIHRYGEVDGKIKYKEYNQSKGLTIEFWNRSYGEQWELKRNEWIDKVKQTEGNFIKRYGEERGKIEYTDYRERVFQSTVKSKLKSGTMFGAISYTDKGEILRSNLELHFYECMRRVGLTTENYSIEYKYPNSMKRSDFYFHDIDCHVEVAGMMNIKWYAENMQNKIDLYKPIVVQCKSEMLDVCRIIKERINAV